MHPALATANPSDDLGITNSEFLGDGSTVGMDDDGFDVVADAVNGTETSGTDVTAGRDRQPYLWRHKPFAALDERAFMDAIEPAPLFLQPGYMFGRRVS